MPGEKSEPGLTTSEASAFLTELRSHAYAMGLTYRPVYMTRCQAELCSIGTGGEQLFTQHMNMRIHHVIIQVWYAS